MLPKYPMCSMQFDHPAGICKAGRGNTTMKQSRPQPWFARPFVGLLNLRIGVRLTLAFSGVFMLMTLMAGFAILRMSEMNERMAHITEGNNQQIASVNKMIYSVSQRAVAIRNLALLKDPELQKQEQESIAKAQKSYEAAEARLLASIHRYDASEAEKALLEAIKRTETLTLPLLAQASELALASQGDEAATFLMEKVRPRQTRWVTVLQTLAGLQDKTSDEYAADAAVAYTKARNLLLAFVAAALVSGIAVAWLATWSITRPIIEAVRLARAVAAGDLTARARLQRGDETGQLLDAMGEMNDHLAEVVSRVRSGSESIATGSSEIATGNSDLSQRTEQQAASLQQTAASMEEIRSTLRNNADTATQASKMAENASKAAVKGGAAVGQVISTMQQITTSSKRIADIISVIDGIAFQTNILALNAAVEAARAGEQGRGFAVVAGEVRNLAQRSAGAAREIKSLINASVETVEVGSRLVKDAGGTMDDIVSQVQRVASLIGEISLAISEQSTGIDQVGEAVTDLDRVTQQNAALVEQSAAAADSLSQQAAQLLASVSVFRLEAQAA